LIGGLFDPDTEADKGSSSSMGTDKERDIKTIAERMETVIYDALFDVSLLQLIKLL